MPYKKPTDCVPTRLPLLQQFSNIKVVLGLLKHGPEPIIRPVHVPSFSKSTLTFMFLKLYFTFSFPFVKIALITINPKLLELIFVSSPTILIFIKSAP